MNNQSKPQAFKSRHEQSASYIELQERKQDLERLEAERINNNSKKKVTTNNQRLTLSCRKENKILKD